MPRKTLLTIAASGLLILSGATYSAAETLREAVETILTTHPEVQTGVFNTRARTEEVRQARADYLPKVDFMAGYGVQEVQEPESDSLNPQVYTLSLRQNLFTGFATDNEVERQRARVRSGAFRLHSTSDLVALRTTEVYLEVLRQQELLELARENLKNHLRINDQIQLRSDSGVSSEADRNQVQGRVALAQDNVVIAETNLIDAKSNYLAVVGNLPGALEKPLVSDGELPNTMEEAEEKAVANHPTLKSADADLEARHKQHEVAASPYWPIIDLEVDQNWEEDFDSEGRDDNLIVMVRLRYNLFNGLRNDARRAETAEQISEAREIRNNTHRQVVESIRLSWMAYQAIEDRKQYLEERVQSTISTADSYLKQFNFGKRTLLDVLDTEAEAIDARRALVNAEYDGMYAQYRILNGMGTLVQSLGLELPEEVQLSNQGQPRSDTETNG